MLIALGSFVRVAPHGNVSSNKFSVFLVQLIPSCSRTILLWLQIVHSVFRTIRILGNNQTNKYHKIIQAVNPCKSYLLNGENPFRHPSTAGHDILFLRSFRDSVVEDVLEVVCQHVLKKFG